MFDRSLSLNFAGIARRLALSGYGVFAMDYPGFGLSEGLHGYIPSFDLLVQDVMEHYSNIKGNNFDSHRVTQKGKLKVHVLGTDRF